MIGADGDGGFKTGPKGAYHGDMCWDIAESLFRDWLDMKSTAQTPGMGIQCAEPIEESPVDEEGDLTQHVEEQCVAWAEAPRSCRKRIIDN